MAAVKALQEQGIAFQVGELHCNVDGLWVIGNPKSTMYERAHLISSKRMTEFADFAMCDVVAEYLSMRRGYCSVPKDVFGKPADTVGGGQGA